MLVLCVLTVAISHCSLQTTLQPRDELQCLCLAGVATFYDNEHSSAAAAARRDTHRDALLAAELTNKENSLCVTYIAIEIPE